MKTSATSGEQLARPVRVKFRAAVVNGRPGFAWDVLAADSLTWLGEGWSLGRKCHAEESFRQQAKAAGWVTTEMRSDRARGAA